MATYLWAGAAFCSIRLLVASTQAVNLIGKQGSLIKPIQQNTGASIRVLSNDEMSIYATPDEKVVEIQGEALKFLKALESVIGHLRKFLVDHSVLPLFEKSYNAPAVQERESEPWSERTMLSTSRAELDPALSGTRTSGGGRVGNSVITQISQTVQMKIPLALAKDIIGIGGANIAYIRRTSGAILTVQESRGLHHGGNKRVVITSSDSPATYAATPAQKPLPKAAQN
ncbi:RNA-binding KH domain-containing protein PEPPER-like [Lycium barbarum]|uniref:RNA-binding KH domain-containing protein PEPPER-like n=1 Tax=Lycium barbarum TaxID=112863 RepID=UPI00293E1E1F|nr:RNA-binding KH domain-containing protein PEPPER-like [Lycium barbarum]